VKEARRAKLTDSMKVEANAAMEIAVAEVKKTEVERGNKVLVTPLYGVKGK
jgi:hypothetical protein|tara:strand:+ start:6530 stop:6682 length:153 start_codon:yes stop_codon:yes gene_type:complete